MATYVLVHGAWSGAHSFRKVRPLLRAEGHEVFTPSLTGIGERVHLTGPHVDLTTHVRDVVNAVLYEDLDQIVLLGFSYGGMVVTGALEHISDRVEHLVYLDAFVPANGQTVSDLAGGVASAPMQLGDEWAVPAVPREYDDPGDAAWAEPRRVPHPMSCFTEPVRVMRALEEYPFTRTYVKATADAPMASGAAAFWAAAEQARSSPTWRYHEIDTNHMIPFNRPAELAAILLDLSASPTVADA